MARQTKQVHIYLYRQRNGVYEYALFQRADLPHCWQGVCGGLEGRENLEEGARRELYEEAGITEPLPLYPLESRSSLPVYLFRPEAQKDWGEDVVVIPMYFFAMPFEGEICLSHEHITVKWLPYAEAAEMIYFTDQKTALYELNEKLRRGILYK